MGDDNNGPGNSPAPRNPWEVVAREIQDPIDWIAAIAGGALGSSSTLLLPVIDTSTGIAGGAFVGLSISKVMKLATKRKLLLRRIRKLKTLLGNEPSHNPGPTKAESLLKRLEKEEQLLVSKSATLDDCSSALDKIIDEYRNDNA